MENKTKEEIGQGTAMTKEDFAALWKTIRLKVTDTYEVPPEILWVNGSTIGTLGNFSASTGKAKSKKYSCRCRHRREQLHQRQQCMASFFVHSNSS